MHDDLTTENILAMSRLDGEAVERLGHLPQADRNRIVGQLFCLLFREIFEFRLIQTDPNFAHYRYAESSQQLILLACEPLGQAGEYDFGRSDLGIRIRDASMVLGMDREFWHTPPADALFLHRKLGGLYLLAAKLGARVDMKALTGPLLGLDMPPGAV